MTPAEYVDEIVLPTLLEFKSNRRSRRHAYLACVTAFHIKDHLKHAGASEVEIAVRAEAGSAFDVVRAICNGTKHVETDRTHKIPFAIGKDWERPPARAGVMQAGISRCGDLVGGRKVGTDNERFDLYISALKTLHAYKAAFPDHLSTCDLSALDRNIENEE